MESGMSSTQAQSATSVKAVPNAQAAEMKIEVIVIPVADVDRAKRFYANLGWRLDLDITAEPQYRVVQFRPTALKSASPSTMPAGCSTTPIHAKSLKACNRSETAMDPMRRFAIRTATPGCSRRR